MQPLRVGLIGLGKIANDLVELVAMGREDQIKLVGAVVRDPSKPDRPLPTYATMDELLAQGIDVVAEIAGHDGLIQHGPAVLEAGIDLVVIGVGAFADREFEARMKRASETGGGRVRVASGAIGALDVLAAASMGEIDSVKHIISWTSFPGISPEEIAAYPEPRHMFSGTAREAALKYPTRVNVAAAVSLAGLGFDKTHVEITLGPSIGADIHRVELEGVSGSFVFEIDRLSGPKDNQGGMLVAKSILHELLDRSAWFSIG